MGAALAANTGAAGGMHRVGFFAAKAAPTGYADCLQFQLSTRQRSAKGWAIYHGLSLAPTQRIRCCGGWHGLRPCSRARPLPQGSRHLLEIEHGSFYQRGALDGLRSSPSAFDQNAVLTVSDRLRGSP
ncbi:protein of unknown function [Pseudomonas sp. JV551A1]|uniref:Uncharacterized protein n=1 Tax=Pseudomonas inefficax TaxID=2078786 RepID=A0AAQ1P480_9PSED|nr:protein of unknown function [Pseudomonas sp. JV551A1]SPO58722.1 protein of unknown function [Pseudomonas inefficax]